MKRATIASLAACLIGCGAAAAAPAPSSPVVHAPVASSEPSWEGVDFPLQGFHVELPGGWREHVTAKGGPVFWLEATTAGASKLELRVMRLEVLAEEDEKETLDRTRTAFGRVTTDAHGSLQGHETLTLGGTTKDGHAMSSRAVVVGPSVYMMQAVARDGSLDERTAERFFASFRLVPVWRVHPSVAGRFTVAVPALAREKDTTAPRLHGRTFDLGGAQELSLGAMWADLPEEALSDGADAALDRGVHAMADEPGAAIVKNLHVEVDGRPGREAFVRNERGMSVRVRMVLTDGRLVMALASSRSVKDLEGDVVRRFLESLRIGGAP